MRYAFFSLAFLLSVVFVRPVFAEDVVAGQRAFAQCKACHSVEPGRNGVGPSLAGVFGRSAASLEGFRYSRALAGLSVIWDEESLGAFLTNPQKYARGTRMAFPGVRNEQQRADIIAYLKSISPEAE